MSIQSVSVGAPPGYEASGDGLVGRTAELTRVDQLLLNARTGQGAGVLALRGDRGIGKTALLNCAAEQAAGYGIIRVRGVESERELPYAALHLMCASLDEGLGHLQPSHREALETAFGLRAGPQLDRFLVGLGMLALLSKAAEAQPLLCIADDAQWLDRSSSQVLAFVARRLKVEPIVVLLAEREAERSGDFDGLPELVLGPLSDGAAVTLVGAAIPGRVDEAVLGRIVAEARGIRWHCSNRCTGPPRRTSGAGSGRMPSACCPRARWLRTGARASLPRRRWSRCWLRRWTQEERSLRRRGTPRSRASRLRHTAA